MHDFLKDFKNLVKGEEVRTDNNVFKLHYRFSVILLIVFSILLSSRQYFGDPINCDVPASRVDIINLYCWVSGTHILTDYTSNKERLGNDAGKQTYTLLYYQWVCLLFCLQALMFYIPRYLWKCWEGDRLGEIVKDLRGPLVSAKWSVSYRNQVKSYILDDENHDVFAYRFAFCELLNLGNLICQTIFMDWYLNGKFARYGYEVATQPWPAPYNAVFPKRTKCLYTKFGPSGSIEKYDALCVLPLNVLNEKFFLILWYWLIVLFAVTIAALIYRVAILTWVQFRTYLMIAQIRSMNKKKIRTIVKHISHGQFFLLYNIGNNVSPFIYKELLISVFESLDESRRKNSIDSPL